MLFRVASPSQIDLSPFKGLKSYEHRLGDTVTGYKFQCVELARRYLVANRGVVFDSIPMAYNICVCSPHADGRTLSAISS